MKEDLDNVSKLAINIQNQASSSKQALDKLIVDDTKENNKLVMNNNIKDVLHWKMD